MKTTPRGTPKPQTRKLRIIAQDPSVRNPAGRILTAEVEVPVEDLDPGPRGYRVHVIDYDASTETLYKPHDMNSGRDHFARVTDRTLLSSPGFHAQNVYAIVMRTLAAFEFALGRRVCWGFDSNQLQIAPHAFAVANAFYSRRDQALLFGYTGGAKNRVFTCLSHDVVAHETTHALVDGMRPRYMEPSSKDQFAFHEGFADVIALLSVFALTEIVDALLGDAPTRKDQEGTISEERTTPEALVNSALLGLGEEIGDVLPGSRLGALRRSVTIPESVDILKQDEFKEEHRRGEVFVAAMMKSFVHVWHKRLSKLGFVAKGRRNRSRVVEDGATAARHLMTMAIRALDYCPPTALTFDQYLAALIAADEDIQPDDSLHGYRQVVKEQFAAYGIEVLDTNWRIATEVQHKLTYERTHFDSLQNSAEEVFRFVWENRNVLNLHHPQAFAKVLSVRPCIRHSTDGFVLRETVAEYLQILNLTQGEVAGAIGREVDGPSEDQPVRLFGGGTLIFDEYGRLKYHARNRLPDLVKDKAQLAELWDWGAFDSAGASAFGALHLARATALPSLASKEETEW